jgi:hypothetical protein
MISAFAAMFKQQSAYLHGYISMPSRQLLSQNQSLEDLERGKFSLVARNREDHMANIPRDTRRRTIQEQGVAFDPKVLS